MEHGWKFWIDRGGTFTDIVALKPDGGLTTVKLLSRDPKRYQDPVIEGIRRLLPTDQTGKPGEIGKIGKIGKIDVSTAEIRSVRIGTTVATNALLESAGEPTLLVTTRGFGDALWIGDQSRPRLFDLEIVRQEPLYDRVVEAEERLSADGTVLTRLARVELESKLRAAHASGIRAVAIVFLHAFANPVHEVLAATIARSVGFDHVTISSEICPRIRFVPRGQTTIVDTYLTPVVRRYFDKLTDQLPAPVMFMQSNGGLASGETVRGKDLIYSGPAGGVVAMARVGLQEGIERLIGFDMGGTSTDVSVYDDRFERRQETTVQSLHVDSPSIAIDSVAAGGGSIIWFDGMRLRVGESSAGADPGPAAYGNGGPLTLTDCQVLLGRLRPDKFPSMFGATGDRPLDEMIVRAKFAELAKEVNAGSASSGGLEALALGFVDVAVQRMALAIRRMTVSKGLDPGEFALVAFGGAAGQHICALAEELGVRTVLVPPAAGLLSAVGIGVADVREIKQRTLERDFNPEALSALQTTLDQLAAEVSESIVGQGIKVESVSVIRSVYLRQQGTDASVKIPFGDFETVVDAFQKAHRARFGFEPTSPEITVSMIEVEGIGLTSRSLPQLATSDNGENGHEEVFSVWFRDSQYTTPLLRRSDLAGRQIGGPALIIDPDTTTVLERGWSAELSPGGTMRLTHTTARPPENWTTKLDPKRLEIFQNLFMHIAERMGDQLRQTARSVNIKERLDYSCAVFDGQGNLIANAPHIPVHLGAMSETVQQILDDRRGSMKPGDSFLSNDPFHGGTHVPDLTVVTPVFTNGVAKPVAFVASRAHHADIGGKVPGSMPSNSARLEDEGVVFDGVQIVSDGEFEEAGIRRTLGAGPLPARNPDVNVADIKAQLAANKTGEADLLSAIGRYGLEVVHAYMHHVQEDASRVIRKMLKALDFDSRSFTVEMDQGQRISVAVSIDRHTGSATIDFNGTSDQDSNSLNAPRAITGAAVLYVLRCLTGQEIPLNSGCLEPIRILISPGSMLDPKAPAAVAGGNVETSQCIVDALLGAFGAQAGSQGTMNNVTFGDDQRQYYETICGGTGAGPNFDGASAVHSHMTNSRITDPEILESRMPVLVEEFAIRRGSGGLGRFRGGDGAVRRIRFLEELDVSILSNRRSVAPHGLDGGNDGSIGQNCLIKAGGEHEDLGAAAEITVEPGDVIVVKTPGGGGFGPCD